MDDDVLTQTVPDDKGSITAFSLFAPMIQINWQSSDLPKSTSSGRTNTRSSRTATETSTSDRDSTDSTDPTGSSRTSAVFVTETLIVDGPQTTGPDTNDKGVDGPTSTPTLQDGDGSSDDDGPLSPGMRVAIAVAGSVAVLLVFVCGLFYCWRRRQSLREEQEMDRLYGMKHEMNDGGDFKEVNDIPGWYRGQRLATPAKDPFAAYAANPGFGPEMERPAAPYYRSYPAM